ncbi:MAG: LarC family nickel insertion protein [Actinobacteria bacterium]|nr:LarC family nickel insertion protein [Actinomycetota bacterium]
MEGMTRHAWLDVSAGVAGDMLLGACTDAGADLAAVEGVVQRVVGLAVRLHRAEVMRAGQRATRVLVALRGEDAPHRTWRSIRTDLEGAPIPEETRAMALGAFAALAGAEGRVHGIDPEDVHFHEVGALDSIADVVGTCEALRQLGVTSVSAGPVALGEGRIRAAHGDIPVPVPAVAQLALGWQVRSTPGRDDAAAHRHAHPHHPHASGDAHDHGHDHAHEDHAHEDHAHGDHPDGGDNGDHGHAYEGPAVVTTPGRIGELATPTGMALVRSLAGACEPLPPMTLEAVGVGAGGRDPATHPNVVRVLVGTRTDASPAAVREDGMLELRANVDDMDPRLWPGVLDALLAAGAADAWLTPILMKRGRPAHCLLALANQERASDVTDAMLRHTTTLGVRSTPVGRTVLERSFTTVEVDGDPVTVKLGHRDGVVVNVAIEFSSARELAARLGTSELVALTRATAAAEAAGLVSGAVLADVEERR